MGDEFDRILVAKWVIGPESPAYGICPTCRSDKTLPELDLAPHRVCLECGHFEPFASYDDAMVGWKPISD